MCILEALSLSLIQRCNKKNSINALSWMIEAYKWIDFEMKDIIYETCWLNRL